MRVKRRNHVAIPLAAKLDGRGEVAFQSRSPGFRPCIRLREIEMVLNQGKRGVHPIDERGRPIRLVSGGMFRVAGCVKVEIIDDDVKVVRRVIKIGHCVS